MKFSIETFLAISFFILLADYFFDPEKADGDESLSVSFCHAVSCFVNAGIWIVVMIVISTLFSMITC